MWSNVSRMLPWTPARGAGRACDNCSGRSWAQNARSSRVAQAWCRNASLSVALPALIGSNGKSCTAGAGGGGHNAGTWTAIAASPSSWFIEFKRGFRRSAQLVYGGGRWFESTYGPPSIRCMSPEGRRVATSARPAAPELKYPRARDQGTWIFRDAVEVKQRGFHLVAAGDRLRNDQ